MKIGTLQDFEDKVARVLELISGHLEEQLPLERLAAEAHLSPYHFHRIWRALTGEPIGETIRRLRIERAAFSIRSTGDSITRIAVDAGFESSQAFAKAFKKAKQVTPTEYRSLSKEPTPLETVTEEQAMSIEIVTIDPFKVVAQRHTGPYEARLLAGLFGDVWYWAENRGLIEGLRGIYGVPHDDPYTADPSGVRYDACLRLAEMEELPEALSLIELGGFEYARMRHIGSYGLLEDTYQHLLGVWLPRSARKAANAPIFNHYIDDPAVTPEAERRTDVYLPLATAEVQA